MRSSLGNRRELAAETPLPKQVFEPNTVEYRYQYDQRSNWTQETATHPLESSVYSTVLATFLRITALLGVSEQRGLGVYSCSDKASALEQESDMGRFAQTWNGWERSAVCDDAK